MLRRTVAILATGAAMLAANAAQAGTSWSIGINLPGAAVVVADGPHHRVREVTPVYYAPAPVVRYAPRHEREVYYVPPPRVVYETRYRDRHVHHHHDHRWDDRRHDRRDDRRDDRRHDRRDDYGPQRGR